MSDWDVVRDQDEFDDRKGKTDRNRNMQTVKPE